VARAHLVLTLTIPSSATPEIIGGTANIGLTIFVSLRSTGLGVLTLTLTSNAGGSALTLLTTNTCGLIGRHSTARSVNNRVPNQIVNSNAQLIFTDLAGSNAALSCTGSPIWAAGEAYAGLPQLSTIRAAFNNLRHDGATYTLSATWSGVGSQVDIVSFGIDYDTNTCAQANQYLVPGLSTDYLPFQYSRGFDQWHSTCFTCGALNDLAGGALPGFSTAHICDCTSTTGRAADALLGYECRVCPVNTYKNTNLQQVGVDDCSACNGPSTGGGAGIASCSGTCFSGYEFTGASTGCQLCAAGTYRQGIGAGACTSCGTGYTTVPASGAFNSTQCVCAPGYYASAFTAGTPTCTVCPVNTYKDLAGNDASCKPCAYNATTASATAQTSCSCTDSVNYVQYGPVDPSGGGCALRRRYEFTLTTCPPDACDGVQVFTPVLCREQLTSGVLPLSACDFGAENSLSGYVAWQTCFNTISPNVQACVQPSRFYIPQVASGLINALIPISNLSLPMGKDINHLTTTVTARPDLEWGARISAQNQLVVHITALYVPRLDTLKIRLTHYGVTIDLFTLVPSARCTGRWGSDMGGTLTAAQVSFSDTASVAFTDCDAAVPPTFLGGEAYIRPIQSLSAFNGLPVEGDYTLTVISTPLAETEISPRAILAWGVTVGPRPCRDYSFYTPGKYIVTPTNIPAGSHILSNLATCDACPSNSNQTLFLNNFNNVNTTNAVTSCPCNPGYTLASLSTCSACGVNTYQPNQSPFTQQIGVSQCLPCDSTGNTVTAGTSRRQACTSDQCINNRAWNAGLQSCDLCPIGTYVDPACGSAPCCVSCDTVITGSTTAAVGATGTSDCTCRPGQFNNAGTCVSCGAGNYRAGFGTVGCSTCVGYPTQSYSLAESNPATCNCTVGYGVIDNTCLATDGSCCQLVPTWRKVFQGPCSSPCDGGNTTLIWECRDSSNVWYQGAQERFCGPKPEEYAICNAEVSCISSGHTYVPRYGSVY